MRDLGWLTSQLNALKGAGVRGFSELPLDGRLDTEDYNGHPNLLLNAGRSGRRFRIGTG